MNLNFSNNAQLINDFTNVNPPFPLEPSPLSDQEKIIHDLF